MFALAAAQPVGTVHTLVAIAPEAFAIVLRLIGIEFRLDLAASGAVPAPYDVRPLALVATMTMPLLWCLGNAWRWKRREL